MRIAIADDDPEFSEQLARACESAGLGFDRYCSGSDMLDALKRETYSAVLVAWNLAGVAGLELVNWVMANLASPPAMILLAGRAERADVAKGLDAGATDCIVMPESDNEVLARIEAALRKARAGDKPRFERFGRYRLDRLQQSIECDGEPIQLTSKEFRVAELLFDNLDRTLSRSFIFAQVWNGPSDMKTRTLDMHISRVRSKLGLRPQNGFAIQTVFGYGYRMDAFDDAAGRTPGGTSSRDHASPDYARHAQSREVSLP